MTCRTPFFESLESRMLFAGTINGVVFDDLNGNGVRGAGEPGLANQIVYIDLNFNGVFNSNEPTAKSNASGAYTFNNRPNGIQRVRYLVPTGRRLTAPARIFYDVAVVGLVTNNINFSSTTSAVATGVVFNDLNGNARRDPGEPGLPGWTVFQDKNNNNKIDSNEKVRVTNSTGAFRFTGLTPGTYIIKVVQQNGWTRTNPLNGQFKFTLGPAQSISNRNFGERVTPRGSDDGGGLRP